MAVDYLAFIILDDQIHMSPVSPTTSIGNSI
jgi:hypothetical protein